MEDDLKETCVLIICGGGGKRLWPESRINAPKQFIKLLGEKTLFQEMAARAAILVPPENIFVQTVAGYEDEVQTQAPQILKENIFAEPMSRNTALAMVYGTLMIKRKMPQATIINLWSDQKIADEEGFQKILLSAVMAANSGDWLVTVGIKPTFPHTGLGYIEAVKKIESSDGVFYRGKFIEKPSLEKAQEFLALGRYFWNTGYYVWQVGVFIETVKKVNPTLHVNLEAIDRAISANDQPAIKKVFEGAEDISIDKAVSEKADNIAVLPAEIGWSDVGDWKTVYDVSPKDENGNVVINTGQRGEFIQLDSKNCLIHLSDQLVAVVGVDDLAIVDTPDALLICKKGKAEDVKKIVELLKTKGKTGYL